MVRLYGRVLLWIHAFLSVFCRLKWKLGDGTRLTSRLLSRLKRSTLRPLLDGMYGRYSDDGGCFASGVIDNMNAIQAQSTETAPV